VSVFALLMIGLCFRFRHAASDAAAVDCCSLQQSIEIQWPKASLDGNAGTD